MIHRPSKPVVAFVALALALFAAVPAYGYNNVNTYDLRLTRLDPLLCGTPIRLQALLTDEGATPASGITVQFAILSGAPGDAVDPTSAVTNSAGIAITRVTIECGSGPPHKVLASVPNDASARITLCGSASSCLRESTLESSGAVRTTRAVESLQPTALARWLAVAR